MKTLQVFRSGTVLYSIHVTEQISCTFCEIVSTKICVKTSGKQQTSVFELNGNVSHCLVYTQESIPQCLHNNFPGLVIRNIAVK